MPSAAASSTRGSTGLSVRARLAIVPGATHYDILSTTAVADLAGRFLERSNAEHR
jgi:hypothetical protein